MELIAKADVVLALGTRLNPFSTLPGYGIDYWPKIGEDHPGRHQCRSHRPDQARQRSASAATPSWWPGKSWRSCRRTPATPVARSARRSSTQTKSAWLQTALAAWTTRTTIRAPTGTRTPASGDADRMSPRQAWRAIQAGLPKDAIISSDIGNNCAIGNAYPTFEEGRKYLAPGLFGPCGYGFPSIIGAKIGMP